MDTDKLAAYQTLYTCLKTVALLMAPFAPFYADRLYSDLTGASSEGEGYASVHLADFPVSDPELIDPALERRMALAQVATSLVLALRRKVNIKVRQPLSQLLVPAIDAAQKADFEAIVPLVAAEVNVKEVKIVDNEESGLVKKVKADFKKLGPRYGKVMKDLGKAITVMTAEQIASLERDGKIEFPEIAGTPVVTLDDVEIIPEDVPGWLVANDGNVTVALDVTVTDELRNEGLARELINRIQNIRKESDFAITDRVKVTLSDIPEIVSCLEEYKDYIASQVLADSIATATEVPAPAKELDIDGMKILANVVR